MSLDFIEGFDRIIKESNEVNYNKIQNKVITDLKLNTEPYVRYRDSTFYPIVYQLMER
jgi:hypothetical protein